MRYNGQIYKILKNKTTFPSPSPQKKDYTYFRVPDYQRKEHNALLIAQCRGFDLRLKINPKTLSQIFAAFSIHSIQPFHRNEAMVNSIKLTVWWKHQESIWKKIGISRFRALSYIYIAYTMRLIAELCIYFSIYIILNIRFFDNILWCKVWT